MKIVPFISSRFNARATLPRSIRTMRVVAGTGIALAVAALVIATAIGRGFEAHYRKALLDFNAHVVVMAGGEMREADAAADRVRAFPVVEATTPFLYREALAVGAGTIAGVVVKGVDPVSMGGVNAMPLRFFGTATTLGEALASAGDAAPPVIVGAALAQALGIGDVPQERRLLIPREKPQAGKAHPFETVRVVGTFASGMHDYDAQFLLMALPAARALFAAAPGTITGIELKLSDPDRAEEAAMALEVELGPRYSAVAWSELNRELLAAVRLEQLVSAIIMQIMVAVAALNIVAVLVLMTIYRLHEISVLKALGLHSLQVEQLLSRGGISLGLWGAATGVALGAAVAWAIGRFGLVPLEPEIYLIGALPVDISPVLCGMITLFCVGVGALTSRLASRRLAGVPIAEGLHLAR